MHQLSRVGIWDGWFYVRIFSPQDGHQGMSPTTNLVDGAGLNDKLEKKINKGHKGKATGEAMQTKGLIEIEGKGGDGARIPQMVCGMNEEGSF